MDSRLAILANAAQSFRSTEPRKLAWRLRCKLTEDAHARSIHVELHQRC